MLFDAIFIIFYILLYNLYLCLNIFLHLQKQLGFYFALIVMPTSPLYVCLFTNTPYQHCSVATRREQKLFLDTETETDATYAVPHTQSLFER